LFKVSCNYILIHAGKRLHKAEDPVIFYLINLLAIRKAQPPCPQRNAE
jgi:hypothetical protein